MPEKPAQYTITFSKCLSMFTLQDLFVKCVNDIVDDALGVNIFDDVEEMTQARHVLHAPVDRQVRAVAVVEALREVTHHLIFTYIPARLVDYADSCTKSLFDYTHSCAKLHLDYRRQLDSASALLSFLMLWLVAIVYDIASLNE